MVASPGINKKCIASILFSLAVHNTMAYVAFF